MTKETAELAEVTAHAFGNELGKLAASEALKNFWGAAKHEVGPAIGAVTGAGLAGAVGIDPLAGAAAGYGLGASHDIVKALREKRMKSLVARRPDIGGGI